MVEAAVVLETTCWCGLGGFWQRLRPPPCAHGPIVDSGSLVKRVDGLLDLD